MGVKGVLLIFCLHWFACVLCTHWPIGPTRYDERPPVDKYCAKLSEPFCPEGEVPSFDDDDSIDIYALRSPIKDLSVKLGVYRVAIAIGSKKTGKNYTAEWLGFSQLYDCTFPHIEVQNRSSPVWCNQAAACISQGIDQVKGSSLAKVATITGKQYKNVTAFISSYNNSIAYYETWRVSDSATDVNHTAWFEVTDGGTFVQNVFCQLAKLGVKVNVNSLPSYSFITLIDTEEPTLLGDEQTIFVNKTNPTLAADIIKFYKTARPQKSPLSFVESFYNVVDYVTVQKKFYLYYGSKYWQLALKYPYIKVSNEQFRLESC